MNRLLLLFVCLILAGFALYLTVVQVEQEPIASSSETNGAQVQTLLSAASNVYQDQTV